MIPIYLSDKGWNTLVCPVCERELIPAYECEEGLEVGYWHDFDPGTVRQGLLVCGDFNCEYQEPVTFAAERVDAVPFSLTQTLSLWEMEYGVWYTAQEARETAEELEQVYAETQRAKLRCAAQYFRQMADDRIERINEWIAAAGREYSVSFQSSAGEHQGRIQGHDEEAILLQAEDGQVVSVPKAEITEERILYPPKRKPRERKGGGYFVMIENRCYAVVEGFHLRFGDRQEDGRYSATTTDPAAAKALQMERVSDDLWRGYFDKVEIQRYYYRHNQVKIKGHWLEQTGRVSGSQMVHVQTQDPEVAQALDMDPIYALVFHEFGTQEGDVSHYAGAFPLSAVEATSWYEEIRPLPDEEEEEGA